MDTPPRHVIDQPKTETETLRILSSYSNELIFRFINTPSSERAEIIPDMAKRYCNSLPIPEKQISSLMEAAATKINAYSEVVMIDRQTGNMMRKLFQSGQSDPSDEQEMETIALSQTKVLPKKPAQIIALPDVAATDQKDGILTNGLREIDDMMKGRFHLNDLLYMIIETMYRGLGLNRVIFCLRDSQLKMVARFGLGENVDKIVQHFQFQIGRTDIFNVVIIQAKGIIIDDAASPNIDKNLPQWYRDIVAAPSFLIYPLITGEGCVGMFYADKKTKGSMLTARQKSFMEDLSGIAMQAIAQKQREKADFP